MVEWIFFANVFLALFNLIPAFPMDGGRVLRAVLSMTMPEQKATQIAAGVGQLIAIAMLAVGLFWFNPLLMLVAVVVLLGAGQEVSVGRTRSILAGHTVQEAMQSQFKTIESGASLESAANTLVEGGQHDFPIVAGEEVIGVLTRTDVARGLATEGPSGYVAGSMRRNFQRITADLPLEAAIEIFAEREPGPLMVMDGDHLLGMLTREGVSEFLLLQDARNRSRAQTTPR
jgi:CBS domain-containing protein